MNASAVLARTLERIDEFRCITADDLPHLMEWRNRQQSVLRQEAPLSLEDQARWWTESVAPSYVAEKPQIMLLACDRGHGISSYGGLTNIDWTHLRAEVSFLAETELAKDLARYSSELHQSLTIYASLAFDQFGLRRLHTETWGFRNRHIAHLEDFGFRPEGRLRQHVVKEGRPVDAIIHGLLADDWARHDSARTGYG